MYDGKHDCFRYGNFLPNDNNRRFHQLLDLFLLLVGNTSRKGHINKSILQYPPGHYKPSFRWKQRVLERALTVLYIRDCLLNEISNQFNCNLTLLGVIAATWVNYAKLFLHPFFLMIHYNSVKQRLSCFVVVLSTTWIVCAFHS